MLFLSSNLDLFFLIKPNVTGLSGEITIVHVVDRTFDAVHNFHVSALCLQFPNSRKHGHQTFASKLGSLDLARYRFRSHSGYHIK